MNTQEVKIAIIIMFKYFNKNMSIVREREIYSLKGLEMKYYVWNENFTISIESRLDNAEEKTSEQIIAIIIEMIQDEAHKEKD